jgi:hypothetical protein
MRSFITTLFFMLTVTTGYTGIVADSVDAPNTNKKLLYQPHYLPIQFAGNIGFISTGIGYSARKDNYQLSLLYGYAPPVFAGVHVHTITAKNIFHIYRFPFNKNETLLPYGSLALSCEIGGRSFLTLPSNMPRGYYNFPKSIHVLAGAGLKWRHMTSPAKNLRGIEFYTEVTTVDAYIWYKFISEEVKMNQIMTLALGVHLMVK